MGVRTSLTNARNKTTAFTSDNAGRLVLTTYPDTTGESATYNLDGQLATRTDGRAYATSYSYDVTGRLTGIDYPTGTDTAFAYLENGARSAMTDRSGTTLWVYNARDEVTQVNSPQGTINSTYLATGQRYTVGRSGGPTTTYSYDDAGRLTSLTNGYSETTTFTLDAVGRCTQQVHANGTKALSTYGATRGWLTALEHQQSNNSVLARYEYTRDAAGHITSVTQPSDHAVAYGYDAAYQLTSEERTGTNAYAIGYTYDAAGNRLTKTQNSVTESYTYGDNNQLLTAGSKTYAYDANGNLTSVTVGTDVTSLTWDYNDKLTGITYPNSATNSFTTNDLGHRVGLTDSGGSTSYLYDGSRVLADSRADYTIGGVSGLISERVGSTSKVYHGDHLGSTRGLTNGSEAITDSREYDAWGLAIASAGSGSPFGFVGGQGYQKDPDSGLMLLGARYYDPSVGRFISRDPIGYKGGLNLYGYCGNNPINASDPSGHVALVDDLIVIGLVAVTFMIVSVVVTDPYVQDAWNSGLNDAANAVGDTLNSIGEGIRQIGDAILSVDFPWHHKKPKYLGGDPDGPLGQWPKQDHIDFHTELDKVFSRWEGKDSFDGVDPDTVDEILDELGKHFPPYLDEKPGKSD